MPLNLQASLLHAVQNQEIVRVGGVSPIPIDTRVICATHRDLQAQVETGQFRADLYYRLNALELRMPALRERDDLAWLADQLLERIALREGLPERPVPSSLRARWMAYDWPGNVRQLETALLRFLISGDERLPETTATKHLHAGAGDHASPATTTLQAHLDRERDAYIRRTLADTDGDKDVAARRLGISRATLYRELRRRPPTLAPTGLGASSE